MAPGGSKEPALATATSFLPLDKNPETQTTNRPVQPELTLMASPIGYKCPHGEAQMRRDIYPDVGNGADVRKGFLEEVRD